MKRKTFKKPAINKQRYHDNLKGLVKFGRISEGLFSPLVSKCAELGRVLDATNTHALILARCVYRTAEYEGKTGYDSSERESKPTFQSVAAKRQAARNRKDRKKPKGFGSPWRYKQKFAA